MQDLKGFDQRFDPLVGAKFTKGHDLFFADGQGKIWDVIPFGKAAMWGEHHIVGLVFVIENLDVLGNRQRNAVGGQNQARGQCPKEADQPFHQRRIGITGLAQIDRLHDVVQQHHDGKAQ